MKKQTQPMTIGYLLDMFGGAPALLALLNAERAVKKVIIYSTETSVPTVLAVIQAWARMDGKKTELA